MNSSLDNLHNIYIPPPVGFEFLLGYIFLTIFISSVIITLIYLGISYFFATRFKRTALNELKTFQKHSDISAIFDLIKRVLLTLHSRDEVANLSGIELFKFMKLDEKLLSINHSIYNPSIELTEEEKQSFYKEVKRWIEKQKAIYD